MMERSYQQQQIEGEIYSSLEQTLSAIPSSIPFGGMEPPERDLFQRALEPIEQRQGLGYARKLIHNLFGLGSTVDPAFRPL